MRVAAMSRLDENHSLRVAGSASVASMEVEPARLESTRHRRFARSQRIEREQVAQAGALVRWRQRIAAQTSSRCGQAFAAHPLAPVARLAATWCRSARFSRGAVDPPAGGRAHREAVCRFPQPPSCGPLARGDELERAAAHAPCVSTQGGQHRRLARRALAGAKSKAKRPGQSIFFVDESGFYPLPAVVRTYAPRGQTPVPHEWVTRDHLSVIAAVSGAGALYCRSREKAFDAVAVSEFLRHLLAVVPGKVLVIRDGAPIHRSKVIKAFLEESGNQRLELEALPGYAPDLNPLDTGVWHWLKNVALANVCAVDMDELKKEVRLAVKRLRGKPSVIKASFVEAKLS